MPATMILLKFRGKYVFILKLFFNTSIAAFMSVLISHSFSEIRNIKFSKGQSKWLQ